MINGKIRTKAHITGEKAIKFIQNEILNILMRQSRLSSLD